MKKIWNWWKMDFGRVSMAIYYLTDGRAPKWAIALWYVMLFPIGLFLLPIALGYGKYLQFKLNKILKEEKES